MRPWKQFAATATRLANDHTECPRGKPLLYIMQQAQPVPSSLTPCHSLRSDGSFRAPLKPGVRNLQLRPHEPLAKMVTRCGFPFPLGGRIHELKQSIPFAGALNTSARIKSQSPNTWTVGTWTVVITAITP